MNNEPEVICINCEWEGDTNQLDGIKCPTCGKSKTIEDYQPENEPLYKYFSGYNWNKK